MNIAKSTLSLAVAAFVSVGMVGQAAAYTSAGASVDYDTLVVNIYDANGVEQGADVVGSFLFRTTNSASLDSSSNPGLSGFDTDTCGGTIALNTCSGAPPVLDSDLIALGATAHAPNTFTLDGPNAGTEYSYADSVIDTAQVVTGGPTAAGVIAETELLTTGDGGASAVIQSNTGFLFTFELPQGPGPYEVEVLFFADGDAYAESDNPDSIAVSAIGTIQATVNLSEDNGLGEATWTPDGDGSNGCDDIGNIGNPLGCTGELDPHSLNFTANVGSDPASDTHYNNREFFSITFTNVTAGDWSFGLDTSADTTVIKQVPEPGILLLLGTGLAGLAGVNRRRRKQA